MHKFLVWEMHGQQPREQLEVQQVVLWLYGELLDNVLILESRPYR